MKAKVKKWGNSASVRIPVAVLRAVRLEVDDRVDVREDAGRIVIEPLHAKDFDLAELVSRITRRNRHQEIDFGEARGREIW